MISLASHRAAYLRSWMPYDGALAFNDLADDAALTAIQAGACLLASVGEGRAERDEIVDGPVDLGDMSAQEG